MKRNILAAVLILGGSLLLGNTVYEGLADAGESNSRTVPDRGMHNLNDSRMPHMQRAHMQGSMDGSHMDMRAFNKSDNCQ
ncbi:hypothetical protein M5X06_02925 [Paenibacillus alvei]|uniref:Uncharacterized protein n=1 Tax=Paenibacillus alvei TaxID=44250 RepID=A0ABT4GWS0_PAEAL|nr:hypothetical protein [Paenibacillus alvei]MCY7484247.1 hypothetical protein [Paenibacillus alvei]MCY9761162.1 hypothetical protein [Paenibacillus alvei]MCY9765794.1 hypothetical protein [Paenibacillus alvei]